MRIAFDIDGTICENKVGNLTYDTVRPLPGAIETLQWLRLEGHTIILITGRHMKTCSGNVGQVIAKQGKTLLDWLARYDIPYDEIHFGKPHYDIMIDDASHKHVEWNTTQRAIYERIIKGPRGPENP